MKNKYQIYFAVARCYINRAAISRLVGALNMLEIDVPALEAAFAMLARINRNAATEGDTHLARLARLSGDTLLALLDHLAEGGEIIDDE